MIQSLTMNHSRPIAEINDLWILSDKFDMLDANVVRHIMLMRRSMQISKLLAVAWGICLIELAFTSPGDNGSLRIICGMNGRCSFMISCSVAGAGGSYSIMHATAASQADESINAAFTDETGWRLKHKTLTLITERHQPGGITFQVS